MVHFRTKGNWFRVYNFDRYAFINNIIFVAFAAKNIILAGVKSVTLHDSNKVELRDLGAQFYLSEVDVGSNRAEACHPKLQELNTAVLVSTLQAELSAAQLSKFDVRAVP